MYIEPWKCTNCEYTGYPGEDGLQVVTDSSGTIVYCKCGNTQKLDRGKDLMILSENSFVRLTAASNYAEHGQIALASGESTTVSFQKRFDFPCKVYFTSQGGVPLHVKEIHLRPETMTVICASLTGQIPLREPVQIAWSVHGLVDIELIPTWYIHFYSGITHTENGLYKAAILDYAAAFETFLESYLLMKLSSRYDKQAAEYLLQRSWKVEERCKNLLELAVGHRLSEREDVYQPWHQDVRKVRNYLAHGERIPIDHSNAQKAHKATYQAIRWVEDIA